MVKYFYQPQNSMNISEFLFRIVHHVMAIFVLSTLKIFAKFKVYNKKTKAELERPFIVIANHRSYFDPFIIGASLGLFTPVRAIRWMAKDKLFRNPLLAFALFILGSFPAYKGKGLEKSLLKPVKILKQGGIVGIFVEGSTFKEREIKPAKQGAVVLAQYTKLPIFPVYLEGTNDLSWWRYFTFQNRVSIIHGEPFYMPSNGPTKQLAERFLKQKLIDLQRQMDDKLIEDEENFWTQYGKIYKYLERSSAYKELLKTKRAFIKKYSKPNEYWLDLGSGSGAVIELLLKKNHPIKKVLATDNYPSFLGALEERFYALGQSKSLEIKQLDLRYKTPFPDNCFDGISANLVIPYITHFEGLSGRQAFKALMREIYRILKPGGSLIWSTPVPGVNFTKVFLASLKDILNPKQLENLYYGPKILSHAFHIARKGRTQLYHFLEDKELKKLLEEIGFTDFTCNRSFANQANVIYIRKPEGHAPN